MRAQGLLADCLARLRVIRPSSLFELLASLEVLRFELQHRPTVVAVDGMSSFYWQDKVSIQQRKNTSEDYSVPGDRHFHIFFVPWLLDHWPRVLGTMEVCSHQSGFR